MSATKSQSTTYKRSSPLPSPALARSPSRSPSPTTMKGAVGALATSAMAVSDVIQHHQEQERAGAPMTPPAAKRKENKDILSSIASSSMLLGEVAQPSQQGPIATPDRLKPAQGTNDRHVGPARRSPKSHGSPRLQEVEDEKRALGSLHHVILRDVLAITKQLASHVHILGEPLQLGLDLVDKLVSIVEQVESNREAGAGLLRKAVDIFRVLATTAKESGCPIAAGSASAALLEPVITQLSLLSEELVVIQQLDSVRKAVKREQIKAVLEQRGKALDEALALCHLSAMMKVQLELERALSNHAQEQAQPDRAEGSAPPPHPGDVVIVVEDTDEEPAGGAIGFGNTFTSALELRTATTPTPMASPPPTKASGSLSPAL